jgi:enoyl-CoA hydratase/carnithine racemase
VQIMPLDEYARKYKHVKFERRDGILQMTLHTNDDEIIWTIATKVEVTNALGDVARDLENKVVIITGTGNSFIARDDLPYKMENVPSAQWDRVISDGKYLIMNHLDIEAPVIAAVNGPALIHSEIALLADIVLASDDTEIQDKPHFRIGMVPGDGVHVVFPFLMGFNRGRYCLLTGHKLSARQALEWGLVAELHPKDRVLPRAWELARDIRKRPPLTARYTRQLFTHQLKRLMHDNLGLGIALEGLAAGDLASIKSRPLD